MNWFSLFQHVESKAYEEELKRYEEEERKELDKARVKAQEAVSYESNRRTVPCQLKGQNVKLTWYHLHQASGEQK